MAYGDGTKPYRRADGYWVARFDAGFTSTGTRRRRVVTAKTEAECKRRLRAALREYRTGSGTLDPKITVKKWADQWLDARRTQARPGVHTTNTGWVRKWVIPTIGHKRLAELTAADLRSVENTMRAAGRSPTTIGNVRTMLGTMLTAARAEGHRIPDAVFAVEKPLPAPSDRQGMSITEAVRLLVAAGNRESWPALPPDPTPITKHGTQLAGRLRTRAQRKTVTAWNKTAAERKHALATDPSRWLAALLQAMRQGEALGLLWEEVDLERDLIVIRWELQAIPRGATIPAHLRSRHLEGRWWLLPPKTRAGERVVPIVPTMHDALMTWHEIAPPSPHGLVWPRPDGHPMPAALDRQAWRGLQAVAGVHHPTGRPYLVHEARHTTATLLQAAGVTPEVIISIVGHASYASTQPYIHRDLSQARAALEAIAGMLNRPAELPPTRQDPPKSPGTQTPPGSKA